MTMLTWLPKILRDAGLNVVEVPGWQTRGHGEMGEPLGVLCHDTAGSSTGDHPSLDTVINGRPDLAGPLSQLFLTRDGTYYVVAAGKCWHAGAGYWQGVKDGNAHFIGIEAENVGDGKDHWPIPQMNAYITGTAAILAYLKRDSVWAPGHKEYALPRGRKVDPSFDMITFRQAVEQAEQGNFPLPASVDPTRAMLRKGDHGGSVLSLQHLLGITEDGNFGSETEAAVKAFQTKNGLTPDGLVGPKTWSKLGFNNQTGI